MLSVFDKIVYKKQSNGRSTAITLDTLILPHFGCSAVDESLISYMFLYIDKVNKASKIYYSIERPRAEQPNAFKTRKNA